MDAFRVRLNCIDHYQATPTRYDPPLRKDALLIEPGKQPKVPVIRVFGSTETGQKVCAHIHGAFPYLFIEYRGPLDKPTVSEYIYRLHLSIDRALAVSYRRDQDREPPAFVARVTLVKGVPFYGFHVGYRFYLKIYMLNPAVISRLADLLLQGVVMGQKFQPYEAHLQYLLQFMTDYNLYGCDYLEAENVKFRAPVPDPAGPDDPPRIWDSNTILPEAITDEVGLPRVSHCAIEVDICVQHILNRKAVRERPLHHDFIEREHPIPSDLKLVPSMAGLWRDETRRRLKRMGKSKTGCSPFPQEALVAMSADPRSSQPTNWIHEEEYREQIRELIEQESKQEGADLTFSNYVQPVPHGDTVKTVLQSVEDLFPENLLPALGLEERLLEEHPDVSSSVQIDEKGILELDVSEEEEEQQQLVAGDSDEDMDNNGEVAVAPLGNAQRRRRPKGPATISTDDREAGGSSGSANEHPQSLVAKLKGEIEGLDGGFGVSGLRSGRRPVIPLPRGLLSKAAELELASRESDPSETLEAVRSGYPKRPWPADPDEVPPKRVRYGDEKKELDKVSLGSHHLQTRPTGARAGFPASRSTPVTLAASSQPKRLSGRGSSQKSQGNQILSFPVVKDHRDPDTILRLSQKSSSQRSDGDLSSSFAKKQVSFDPLLLSAPEPTLDSGTSPFRTSMTVSASPSAPLQPKLHWSGETTMYILSSTPPSAEEVCSTMQSYGLPDVIYQDAFYSKDEDVPPRPREYAGKEYRLEGNTVPYLPGFDPTGQSPATYGVKPEQAPDLSEMESAFERQQLQCSLRSWEIADPPPTFAEVKRWWDEKVAAKQHKNQGVQSRRQPPLVTQGQRPDLSQIVGPTPRNTHEFKYSQRQKSTSVQHEAQYMSTMSLEIHVNTRGKLVPNPEHDEVQCIFWCLRSDEQCLLGSQSRDDTICGVVVLSKDGRLAQQIRRQISVEVAEESSELDLMIRMVEIVRAHDPDILAGYEVHGSSWGYLIERAMLRYDYDLCNEFSRTKSETFGKSGKEADRWGFKTTSMLHVTGRHIINIWRAMRGELNLLQYSMENVVWHLLHRRIPHFSWRALTDWWSSGRPRDIGKVLRYYLARTRMDIEILEANELIPRTSEQARLLGVDFFSVFSRGSQFKVESIMFRIAKPENFLLVSPSRKQVGAQNALECLPLVMEPQSAFYPSPLLVLDFQSLYPSVMIAYNYCYSTCLGRVVSWRGTNKLGFTDYRRREGILKLLRDHINIAPNGMMYTKPEIRKSLLAKMLTEILETRMMVKSGMREDKDDRTLQKLLNNRQLALKLLANVTYGYTSASFSGRMPCSEIADSIVQTGRETLERAIAYIHSVERWGAEVVYGDTDSLFVYLRGKTREQAFDIGAEMADEITRLNPRPVKLKFEKVYHPCVLLAKKRYVGYKYESRDQTVPEFDAKGIETVRRDGTPAEQKMEEKALRILFETADLSQVKAYFQSQCSKVMRGAVSVQDFVFAREVRLGSYGAKGPGPPGALVSARRMLEDRRAEPQYGERVPYVVVAGAPGARLVDRCVAPEDLLDDPHASLDAEYYITKNLIPPLERIFNLVGANVRAWYDEMPKAQPVRRLEATAASSGRGAGGGGRDGGKKTTLEFFMSSASCLACNVKTSASRRPAGQGRRYGDVVRVCQSCAGFAPLEGDVPCDSRDCPVFYTRAKQRARVAAESRALEPVLARLGAGADCGGGRGRGREGWIVMS
ncbi:hypothetical protein VTH06DRAFT_8378 [Thermothelomyces fergusii]